MEENKATISSYFNGEILYISLTGVYSWLDDKFGHEIELAFVPQGFNDLLDSCKDAYDYWKYRVDVIPTMKEEIGDIGFREWDEYPWFSGRGCVLV